jgi:hypothetical protein
MLLGIYVVPYGGDSMSEKRKYKRLPIKLALEVSNMFSQDGSIDIGNAEFNVFNISKAGLGFTSTTEIPLGYYFNATIEFEGTEDCMKYVVKVIRSEELEGNEHLYGCEFVGLASIYDSLFEKYENTLMKQEEE